MKKELQRFSIAFVLFSGIGSLLMSASSKVAFAQAPSSVVDTCPGGTPPCAALTCPPAYTKCDVDTIQPSACACFQ